MNDSYRHRVHLCDAAGNVILWVEAAEGPGFSTMPDLAFWNGLSKEASNVPTPDTIGIFSISESGAVKTRFWNRDGTKEMLCGNAIRCLPLLLGIFDEWIAIDTPIGRVRAMASSPSECMIDVPRQLIRRTILAGVGEFLVDAGTPHLVTFVPDLWTPRVKRIGRKACRGDSAVNVTFVRIDETGLLVRTFERGVGETRSCGTGALSAFVSWEMITENAANKEIVKQITFVSGEILGVRSSQESVTVEGSCHKIQCHESEVQPWAEEQALSADGQTWVPRDGETAI